MTKNELIHSFSDKNKKSNLKRKISGNFRRKSIKTRITEIDGLENKPDDLWDWRGSQMILNECCVLLVKNRYEKKNEPTK